MEDTTLQLTATLLAADDGNVFFYAALVFIAFVSWVVGRVKEAIARFQEAQRDKSRQLHQRQGRSPSATQASTPPPAPVMSQKERSQAALRATYEALGIPLPEDSAPVSASVNPDDLLTRDEREALRRQQQRAAEQPKRAPLTKPVVAKKKAIVQRPKDSYTLKTRGRETRDPSALRKMLRDRSTIRQAILLKEILDPPKALRKDNY